MPPFIFDLALRLNSKDFVPEQILENDADRTTHQSGDHNTDDAPEKRVGLANVVGNADVNDGPQDSEESCEKPDEHHYNIDAVINDPSEDLVHVDAFHFFFLLSIAL